MNAVWFIHARQLANRTKFWAAIVGYNPQVRFISQFIYLTYVAIFFSLWGFAVLALLADLGAQILSLFKEIQPSTAAALILTTLLLVDAIVRGYRSGRRSPFIFSEVDATLICQTPIDRRQVAMAWMVGDWLAPVLPYLATAVVLRFASIQMAEPGGIQWSHLPTYWLAGLRVVSILIPIHLAFTAADFALGAIRLRDDRDNTSLRMIPVVIGIILISLALIFTKSWPIFFWPVLYPLQSGFGDANWLGGFLLAVLLAMSGLVLLNLSSPRLNLSRAAQETHFRWIHQQSIWLGDSKLSRQLKVRQRLGSGHEPTRFPELLSEGAFIWKDWVVSLRVIKLTSIGSWIGIFGASLAMMAAHDWGMRIWALIIWCVLIGQRCTERFRSDLEYWVISRLLPFSVKKALAAEIIRPVIGAILASFIALVTGVRLGIISHLSLALLIPGMVLCVVFTALIDILRRCRSSNLIVGQVPDFGAGGVVISLLLTGLPMILVQWMLSHINDLWAMWFSPVIGLVFNLGIAYSMWRIASDQYRSIK